MSRVSATALEWAGLLVRLVLGAVLLLAGTAKLANLAAAANAVRAYQLFDYDTARLVGIGLPVLEVTLGLALLLGLATRYAAPLAGVLMLVFAAGIVSAWARGLHIDCGCFGGGGPLGQDVDPGYLAEILRDVALAAGAGWLSVRPRTPASLDGRLGLAD